MKKIHCFETWEDLDGSVDWIWDILELDRLSCEILGKCCKIFPAVFSILKISK